MIGAGTPFLARQGPIAEWGTLSKALEISIIVNTLPLISLAVI
jgi:hypothetical protein